VSAQTEDSIVSPKGLDYVAFQNWVKQSPKLVLVHFKADWCMVCLKEKPLLDQLQAENKNRLVIRELDLDDNPLIGKYYEIDALPVHMLFENGKMVWNKVGLINKLEFVEVLNVLEKGKKEK
jgi:thioredoxin-like negative regulator of GroEL